MKKTASLKPINIHEKLSQNAMKMISGLGNCSYLYAHIEFFEKKLPAEIAAYEQLPDTPFRANYAYQNCPHFIAWIRLYPEFICNRAMASLSRSEKLDKDPTKYNFSNTAKGIFKVARERRTEKNVPEERLEAMIKAFKLTIELRHTIQHGGLPSVLRAAPFCEDIDLADVARMASPINYRETKVTFSIANELISFLPQPIIIGKADGSIELQDEKDSKVIYRLSKK